MIYCLKVKNKKMHANMINEVLHLLAEVAQNMFGRPTSVKMPIYPIMPAQWLYFSQSKFE